MIALLPINKMMLKVHQGVPEGSLRIIHHSSNGNLPRPSLHFQFTLKVPLVLF